MANARTRRSRSRSRYLARLARENPERFAFEWGKRLTSWEAEVRRRARRLTVVSEAATPQALEPVFSVVDEAMAVVERAGLHRIPFAWAGRRGELGAVTHKALADACAGAVAEVVDRRLYPRSPMALVCRRSEQVEKRPPR